MNIKMSGIRAIRKTAHLTRKATLKTSHFLFRVENKTSRIILGTDSSFSVVTSVPIEKAYYEKIPYIVPLHPALSKKGRNPYVNLLLPSLDKGSFFGGTATAIIAAGNLAMKLNLDLRIIQTLKHGAANVDDFLAENNVTLNNPVCFSDVSGRSVDRYGYIDIHPDDIHMASAWWDAYILDRLPLTKKYIYLIQDFEPIFYNNSDMYALAESTYHSENFIALCNTKLMYEFMTKRNYKNVSRGTWFEPAVNREIIQKKKNRDDKKKLFLYGRPNVDRNLFFTALNALDVCFTSRYLNVSEWDIVMAGQDHLPDIELNSGQVIKNLGKLDMPKYMDLLATTDIALSPMMAPHPNYPTLEFAAAGAAVVTTRYDVKQDLSYYSPSIVMCDISADSMAGAIRVAADIKNSRSSMSNNIQKDWGAALDKPMTYICSHLSLKS